MSADQQTTDVYEPLYRPDAVLRMVQAQHGAEGLRAVAAFMHAMGAEAYLSWDEYACPCDMVMQEAWSLGGEPKLHVIEGATNAR